MVEPKTKAEKIALKRTQPGAGQWSETISNSCSWCHAAGDSQLVRERSGQLQAGEGFNHSEDKGALKLSSFGVGSEE